MSKTFNDLRHYLPDLDNTGLPPGHQERFEGKLAVTRKFSFRQMTSLTAAAVILLFILFCVARPSAFPENDPIREVAGYYRMQLNTEIDLITSGILQQIDPQNREEVAKDLRQMGQESLEPAEEQSSMTQEERINCIIRNYNARIESLANIREILQTRTSHQPL